MVASFVKRLFGQEVASPYELLQLRRTINVMLRVILVAGFSLFLVNIYLGAWNIAVALLVMSVLCLPALWLNSRGRHQLSAFVIVTMMFFVADYNLYMSGGVRDSGVLAFPMMIIIGSLFFGRRSIPLLTLASLGSLALLAYLEFHEHTLPGASESVMGLCLTLIVLLITSGALVWVIIRNTEINVAHIRQAEAELRKTYDLTLSGWAKALEYRDSETEGHSRRVVDLSVRLAVQMGYGGADLDQIRRGALLHDIGKMTVPDHILSKPGPLDDEEKKVMEKHTIHAREMLAPISFLEGAALISYCHHERWDGKGYPRGLKGEEIPWQARLFSVVDQWDALTSKRPYRNAWTKDEVVKYISENSGKRFDPEVVEAFLRIVG